MKMNRRTFLGTALAAGGALAGGRVLWRTLLAEESEALPIPELIDASLREQPVTLEAMQGHSEFFPGQLSPTLGYNGSYLGPTICVRRGSDVQISVVNSLDEPTTVHWHGLLIPGELDGGPHQMLEPGQTWQPLLPIRQPAATLWYHSHVHGRTARQVYAGLAGLFLVTDDEEKSLGLPTEYGVDDLPLVLQDREFEDGRLMIPRGMMTAMHGRRGGNLMVNGKPNPSAKVPGKLVRLRLVNGANARSFNVSFSDQRSFHWIASDGGLLEKSLELDSLQIAPGERAEILVDFSDGRPVALETGPDRTAPMMGMIARAGDLIGVGGGTLVRFEPQNKIESRAEIPERLSTLWRPKVSEAVRRRRFTMTMGMGMMGYRSGMLGINGRAFDMRRIDEEVRLGDVEIWEIHSEMMAHPFHIHGVHFEVLSRNGGLPGPLDAGLKDTVLVDGSVELLVKFTQPARAAPFMYHCHILEHEDNGMMGQFTVS